MKKLPGKNASSIWFDQPYLPNKAGYAYRTADVPSTYTEKKRINFLRSLARHMTAIRALSFDKIGMPMIPKQDALPTIGPHYRWKNDGTDEAIQRATADSAQSYAITVINTKYPLDENAPKDTSTYKARGNRKIFDIVFSQPIFCPSEPETFTIHHNDLDFQNILVDDDGNVTGILDWDASYTAPRCIGAAAVPIFLRNDWFPRYVHDLRLTPHMAWYYQHYREVYAAAMVEAGNPDAHFTLNSAIYQSAFAAVTEFGERYSFVKKLVRQIPNCMVDAHDFQLALSLGWPAAQEWLTTQLPKIFGPKLPRSNLLAQLDADIIMKEWWLTFDTYLEEDVKDVHVASDDKFGAAEGKEGDTDAEDAT
jgi:hypothetical protein